MTAPTRIQRRRAKGWRMPPGAIYVGRGSKWGNPFIAARHKHAAAMRAAHAALAEQDIGAADRRGMD